MAKLKVEVLAQTMWNPKLNGGLTWLELKTRSDAKEPGYFQSYEYVMDMAQRAIDAGYIHDVVNPT